MSDLVCRRGSGQKNHAQGPAHEIVDTTGHVDVACFTKGTMIATARGEVPVEELCPGEKVLTRDNGVQELRWIGAREFTWRTLASNAHIRPVLIRRGALGDGMPERDMMLSPNHRVLVPGDYTLAFFDEPEVLAAARHLVGNDGIHEVDAMGVTYLHLLFDQHEVILSDGAWTESFQPSDFSLMAVGNAQRLEILELFPELKTADGIARYAPARRVVKSKNADMLN